MDNNNITDSQIISQRVKNIKVLCDRYKHIKNNKRKN